MKKKNIILSTILVIVIFLSGCVSQERSVPPQNTVQEEPELLPEEQPVLPIGGTRIYFGLFTYRGMEEIEELIGKKPSILQFGITWGEEFNGFPTEDLENTRKSGSIPEITWSPSGFSTNPSFESWNQPQFQLQKIIRGDFDEYIKQFARDAKTWGHPFFLRFAHEMNGNWYPWSETVNGNSRGEYVQMWKHVHNVFEEECPRCATWVWAPDTGGQSYTQPVDFTELYPGDEYTDWVGLSVYNVEIARSNVPWEEFEELVEPSYEKLQRIAPDKPIFVAETGVVEVGGNKAQWIRKVSPTLKTKFPAINAYSYFDIYREDFPDSRIDTSPESKEAFREMVSDPYFSTNEFSELDTSPIPPLTEPYRETSRWLTPSQKLNADKLISVFENGIQDIQYDYVEYLGDGRGYTVGRGFTTGSGDAHQVAALYTEQVPRNPLTPYLAKLKELSDESSDSLAGLEGFSEAWKEAAKDSRFQAAQDKINDQNSYIIAMEFADSIGIKTALTRVALYDTVFTHGPGLYPEQQDYLDGTTALLQRTELEAGGTPMRGIDEEKWLRIFLQVRKVDMLNPYNKATQEGWIEASGRVDVFLDLLNEGKLNFATPLIIKRGYDTIISDTATLPEKEITWHMKGVDIDVSLEDMQEMHEAGIMILTTEWGMDEEVSKARSFLNGAQRAGLKVVMDGGFSEAAWGYDYNVGFSDDQVPVWQENKVKQWVSALKDHPALFGWDISSEDGENFPNGFGSPLWPEKSSLTITQLKKASATVRAVDPQHPILLRMHYWDPSPNPFGAGNWFADGIADIVMLNLYSNYAEDGKTAEFPTMIQEEGQRHIDEVHQTDPGATLWIAVGAFEAETHVGYFLKPTASDLRRDIRAVKGLSGVSGIGFLEWGPNEFTAPYWYLPQKGADLWHVVQEEISVVSGEELIPKIVPRNPLLGYRIIPLGEAFEEDFMGNTLNEKLWEIDDGYKYWDSWFSAPKVSINNSVLKLVNDALDKTADDLLKVGGIRSAAYYSYGTFTFKAKSNPAKGMVSALFLYNEDKDMNEGGTHEEIDVELSSLFPCKASLVTYHNDDWTSGDLGLQNDMHRGGIKDLCVIPGLENYDSRKLNTYVIDWQPGKIIWYINGIKVEELTNAVPTTPMQILLDTYNTHEWDAFVERDPEGSGVLEIDYVRYVPFRIQ